MAETRRGVPGAILAELQGQGHGKSARSPCAPGGPDQVRSTLPFRTRPDGGGCPLPRPLSRSSPGSQPYHQPDLRGVLPARGKGWAHVTNLVVGPSKPPAVVLSWPSGVSTIIPWELT